MRWDAATYQDRLRHSAIKRVKLPVLHRNASIVIRNHQRHQLVSMSNGLREFRLKHVPGPAGVVTSVTLFDRTNQTGTHYSARSPPDGPNSTPGVRAYCARVIIPQVELNHPSLEPLHERNSSCHSRIASRAVYLWLRQRRPS